MRFLRAAFVLALFVLYLSYLFQLARPRFWNAGLSHWLDPYFINALLEHWFVSLREAVDPSSPPMFFPARKTLGYSHGLVLYTPFYVPLRLFLHPFQAYNWTIFLVLAVGIVSLYVLFRKLGLSLVESLAVAALFFTSQNVVNEPTSAWTQRASVFLIPPILLLLLVSARMHRGRSSVAVAGLAGLLSTLMYAQDFYTAHFALLFAAAFLAAAAFAEGGAARVSRTIRRFRAAQTQASRIALVAAAIATAWTLYVRASGGGDLTVLGVEISSHDVRRPAAVALSAWLVFLWLNRGLLAVPRFRTPGSWVLAATAGAAAGVLLFLWIYAAAYLEHRGFAEEHLLSQLLARDPSRWNSPLDVLRDLMPYDSMRSFVLVLIVAVLVWIPQVRAGRRLRIYWMWVLAISFAVLLVPLRFPGFSAWRVFVEPLPGFGVIRDPKRIVHLYELAVALATAALLASLDARSAARAGITLLVVCLIAAERLPAPFTYERSIGVFDRWVAAPLAVDPSCRSFYIKPASARYMSRSDNMWAQYSIDALFVSLNHGIPTLNGYSALFPERWNLHHVHEPGYDEAVTQWIDRNTLAHVCELDIDRRTMTPR